jgi:hypothetical protein
VKGLALSSVQFLGVVKDAELPSYRATGVPSGSEMCSLSAGKFASTSSWMVHAENNISFSAHSTYMNVCQRKSELGLVTGHFFFRYRGLNQVEVPIGI